MAEMAAQTRPELSEVAVRVSLPGEPSADMGALAEWIRRHDGVHSVVQDSPSGTILVRYDETRAAGRFFRGALLDRARATRAMAATLRKKTYRTRPRSPSRRPSRLARFQLRGRGTLCVWFRR